MDSIISPSEVEFFIETIRPHHISELGSESWLEWHERLQKLNQEATIEASSMKEEYVKETFITFNKSHLLINEAISINVWKQKVLPLMLRLEPNPETTFIAYSILYHEVIAISLLELIMFYGNGCESLGDNSADLLEYAYDGAAKLLVTDIQDEEQKELGVKDLVKHKEELSFNIGIRCLSIVRYLAEHMERASLSIVTRMYNVHDIPVLLVQILLQKPWIKNGKMFKHGKWINENSEALNQAEAQIWIALRQLLLDRACVEYYSLTDSRRSQLVKLLSLITPTLLDQVSPLIELNRWLCQLSVSELPSATQKPILLEAVLEIRNNILQQGNGKWKKIARQQVEVVFCNDKDKLYSAAQRLNAAFNTDLLEKFEATSTGNCNVCGKEAAQRCSKCKTNWYCSRSCQVNDWKNHKEKCME